jgi:hypothetical protein
LLSRSSEASFQVAFRIVSRDWWRTQLPERPPSAENLPA